MKSNAEETDDGMKAAKKRYEHRCKQLVVMLFERERDEKLQVEASQKTQECLLQILQQRNAQAFVDMNKAVRTIVDQQQQDWTAIQEGLTSPDGIFLDQGTHWMLDFKEDQSRMRRKLVINRQFNDHLDASLLRDKTDAAYSITPETPPLPSWKPQKTLVKRASNISLMEASGEDAEEWDLLLQEDLNALSKGEDKLLFETECQWISMMSAFKGRFEIRVQCIRFILDPGEIAEKKLLSSDLPSIQQWPLSTIREFYPRRFQLQNTAMEFFFVDRTNVLFDFPKGRRRKIANRVSYYKLIGLDLVVKITQVKPPNLLSGFMGKPLEHLNRSQITEKWRRREISNFDYLMALNTISGRTYNDLTQYPVFPWIVADYQSEKLDLSDPKSYRDLSKPIGALNPTRLKIFQDRYQSMDKSTGMPRFHYGTHYSSAASVLFYLLRLEPFTTLHIALQNGKFDHADRQFHSIASTWKSCLDNTGDVKELIPEFFYLPEMLQNSNHFDLGTKQSGKMLGNVILPPWASSAEEFVRIHRQALESDYVR